MWSPKFVWGLLHEVVFENNLSDHENMIHLMPHRNACGLYIHLAFTYSIGPSSVVWSEIRPTPPFPPMRVLEMQWSRPSILCVMWPLLLYTKGQPSSRGLLCIHYYHYSWGVGYLWVYVITLSSNARRVPLEYPQIQLNKEKLAKQGWMIDY